jgi:hypothetical protein
MPSTPITIEEVRTFVAMLVGLPFNRGMRALDMEMFEFGEAKPWIDKFGRDRMNGDVQLHVQASWRIVQGDRIVTGYSDYADPPDGTELEGFNRETSQTRRDALLDTFHAERTDPRRSVQTVDVRPTGDLTITIDDGSRLEVRPDSTGIEDEYWRLFARGYPRAVVVGGWGAYSIAANPGPS